MKLLLLSFAIGQAVTLTSHAVCQDVVSQPERPYLSHTAPPRLYFSMGPTEKMGRVELSALSAQLTLAPERSLTSAEVQSLLQLSGDVHVTMCAPSHFGCEKWVIDLRADTVDYNEQTREINAHGDVHIQPIVSRQTTKTR
jgi:hypothetical protein